MSLRARSDRGAAAVEFALVAPILILLVVGIAEFGRAYNVQNSLSAAAREGVRVMALKNDPAKAQSAAINAAPSVDLSSGDVAVSSSCSPGADATVTIPSLLVTLALAPKDAERLVWGAEHGTLWLSAEPVGTPNGGTQILDGQKVYQ